MGRTVHFPIVPPEVPLLKKGPVFLLVSSMVNPHAVHHGGIVADGVGCCSLVVTLW